MRYDSRLPGRGVAEPSMRLINVAHAETQGLQKRNSRCSKGIWDSVSLTSSSSACSSKRHMVDQLHPARAKAKQLLSLSKEAYARDGGLPACVQEGGRHKAETEAWRTALDEALTAAAAVVERKAEEATRVLHTAADVQKWLEDALREFANLEAALEAKGGAGSADFEATSRLLYRTPNSGREDSLTNCNNLDVPAAESPPPTARDNDDREGVPAGTAAMGQACHEGEPRPEVGTRSIRGVAMKVRERLLCGDPHQAEAVSAVDMHSWYRVLRMSVCAIRGGAMELELKAVQHAIRRLQGHAFKFWQHYVSQRRAARQSLGIRLDTFRQPHDLRGFDAAGFKASAGRDGMADMWHAWRCKRRLISRLMECAATKSEHQILLRKS